MERGSELPDIDIPRFDDEKIADQVIWSLVDYIWEDDWRENSFVGNNLTIMRRGSDEEGKIDVRLEAYTELFDEEDDEYLDGSDEGESHSQQRCILSTAEISIRRHVTDERRDMMIQRALSEVEEDEEDELSIEDYDYDDEEKVVAQIEQFYMFDTDGCMEKSVAQRLADIKGNAIWHSESASDLLYESSEDPDTGTVILSSISPIYLDKFDLHALESGLLVFNAPKDILQALRKIRQRPVN